ncbi:uncharacterized protein LOC119321109 [Triticum dicoccoides]|uniref:uncharacterized protein LOC119321109 n=1 Tax=Triticum dicoccoides TaxID=85692 RepID=UPI001890F19D|nr:uncharacterized protein LOC119321109 [Triticum dicoccoides]
MEQDEPETTSPDYLVSFLKGASERASGAPPPRGSERALLCRRLLRRRGGPKQNLDHTHLSRFVSLSTPQICSLPCLIQIGRCAAPVPASSPVGGHACITPASLPTHGHASLPKASFPASRYTPPQYPSPLEASSTSPTDDLAPVPILLPYVWHRPTSCRPFTRLLFHAWWPRPSPQVKGVRVSLCLMFQPLSLLKTGGVCATHSGDYEIGAVSSSLVCSYLKPREP